MNRQLSEAVEGDVFRIPANLIGTSNLFRTGYIIVNYVKGDNINITDFDINTRSSDGYTGSPRRTGLNNVNTTFVEHIQRGPIAMAAGRRRRKSRKSRRSRRSRRRR